MNARRSLRRIVETLTLTVIVALHVLTYGHQSARHGFSAQPWSLHHNTRFPVPLSRPATGMRHHHRDRSAPRAGRRGHLTIPHPGHADHAQFLGARRHATYRELHAFQGNLGLLGGALMLLAIARP